MLTSWDVNPARPVCLVLLGLSVTPTFLLSLGKVSFWNEGLGVGLFLWHMVCSGGERSGIARSGFIPGAFLIYPISNHHTFFVLFCDFQQWYVGIYLENTFFSHSNNRVNSTHLWSCSELWWFSCLPYVVWEGLEQTLTQSFAHHIRGGSVLLD